MIRICILVLATTLLSATWAPNDKKWERLLEQNELEFTLPANYKAVPVRENKDLYYNYAIKHKSAPVEVRYSIMPLKGLLEDYAKKDGKVQVDPNTLYRSMLTVNIMNVSQLPEYFQGGTLPNLEDFPAEAVQKEFNADMGSSGVFDINKARTDYGQGYGYGIMFVIHRQNVADVTVCLLAKDLKTLEKYMMDAFYALKFKAK